MANEALFDLDKDVREFVEFTLKGKKYRLQELTTEQVEELSKKSSEPDVNVYQLWSPYITKVDEDAPEFSEVSRKMTMGNWANFNKMIKSMMGQ